MRHLLFVFFLLQALDDQFLSADYSSKHFTKMKFSLKDKAIIQCEIKKCDKCTVNFDLTSTLDARTKVCITMFQHFDHSVVLNIFIYFKGH